MGLSVPDDAKYQARARRFAGLYMGEDPEAPNYDPQRKLIRSLINGSRGPMLRKATPIDWVGDPIRHPKVHAPATTSATSTRCSRTTRNTATSSAIPS